jgi:hypothetical protein
MGLVLFDGRLEVATKVKLFVERFFPQPTASLARIPALFDGFEAMPYGMRIPEQIGHAILIEVGQFCGGSGSVSDLGRNGVRFGPDQRPI